MHFHFPLSLSRILFPRSEFIYFPFSLSSSKRGLIAVESPLSGRENIRGKKSTGGEQEKRLVYDSAASLFVDC